VLTTRWLPGATFEAFLASNPSQATRDAVGEALYSFYVGTLYRTGHFHGDPHPGNYAFTGAGRVVVYDFGCVRTFPPDVVRALAQLVGALRADEPGRLRAAGRALGFTSTLEGEDFTVFRRFARGFFGPLLQPGVGVIPPDSGLEARQVARDKLQLARLGMPGRLLFLLRIRFGLYAVLSRLGARVDWGGLEARWASDAAQGLSAP
jgi:predicted unusual protein kinase regulating ubiquinone biosynthesis (AarF/ABC1/UbiB family)